MAIDETERCGGKVRFRVDEGFAKFRNDPRQSEPPECDIEAKGVRPGRGHKCNRLNADPARDQLPAVHRRFTRPSTDNPRTIREEVHTEFSVATEFLIRTVPVPNSVNPVNSV